MYMYCIRIRSYASSNELQSFPHLFHVYVFTLNVHSVYQCISI